MEGEGETEHTHNMYQGIREKPGAYRTQRTLQTLKYAGMPLVCVPLRKIVSLINPGKDLFSKCRSSTEKALLRASDYNQDHFKCFIRNCARITHVTVILENFFMKWF